MIVRLALLALAVLTMSAGCKDWFSKGDPVVTAETSSRIEALRKDEADFLARRDNLRNQRKSISDEKAALAEKRRQVAAAGGDLKAVDDEEQALLAREAELTELEGQLQQNLDQMFSKYEELAAGAGTGDVARREASVAVREKDFGRREDAVGRREAELAKREAELAARERDLAKREKETCGGGVTTIVQAPAAPAGTRYTKRDVEPVLKKARKKMSEKGILRDDLPTTAQGLEKEATSAMADADFGRAKIAADTFLATVEGMKIDRAFISAKIARLNAAIKAQPPAADKRGEVDDLFRGATGDYGDGKFSSANGKLNKILSIIR